MHSSDADDLLKRPIQVRKFDDGWYWKEQTMTWDRAHWPFSSYEEMLKNIRQERADF